LILRISGAIWGASFAVVCYIFRNCDTNSKFQLTKNRDYTH
jgi:hypothetical protein